MAQLLKICVLTSVLIGTINQPVFADQINGNWCSPSGKTLSIDGAQVTTPYGNSVTANHDRHHIDYEIPAGEPNAGGQFSANQLSDEEISVKIVKGKPPVEGKSEIWTPCKPTV
ncbi:MAG: hypothetical protein GY927_05635 [bacterium]|nr:hypothetical protein [bacterium]